MSDKCKNGSTDGSCCCNCKHQMKLFSHPWNKDFGKGSISEQCGFVCTGLQQDNKERIGIFSDSAHGLCELHTLKL